MGIYSPVEKESGNKMSFSITNKELDTMGEAIDTVLEPNCSGDAQFEFTRPTAGCMFCDNKIAESQPTFAARLARPFIVCSDCGNKRCPKAIWHGNDCTNSNGTGQKAISPDAVYRSEISDQRVKALIEEVRASRNESLVKSTH